MLDELIKDYIKFENERTSYVSFNCIYCDKEMIRVKGKDSHPKYTRSLVNTSKHWQINTYKTCNKCCIRQGINV